MPIGNYVSVLRLGMLVHPFVSDFLCVPFASLRLCGEGLELEVSMNAAGAEDAVGIEGAFEFFVDGEQAGGELLDAVAVVAAAEQGRVSTSLVRDLERH